jgi:hypothetical protein
MEQNVNNKIEFKDKLSTFYNSNKKKIYSLLVFLLIILIIVGTLKINYAKKNNLIAEQFIQADLYFSANKKEQSIELYEKIIFKKNKFYSILALNSILEKNLATDKEQILSYFETIQEINKSQEQEDLIIFKKALYLIKIENKEEGNALLKSLIEKDSKLKFLVKEIISE